MFLAGMINKVLRISILMFFVFLKKMLWKHGRVVEGNSLENCHGETHREFESHCFLNNVKVEKRFEGCAWDASKCEYSVCSTQTVSRSEQESHCFLKRD